MIVLVASSKKEVKGSDLLDSLESAGLKSRVLLLNPGKDYSDPRIASAIIGYCSQLSGKFSSVIACFCVMAAVKKEFSKAIKEIGFISGKKFLVVADVERKILEQGLGKGFELREPKEFLGKDQLFISLEKRAVFFAEGFL